jgi:hypothetical protein
LILPPPARFASTSLASAFAYSAACDRSFDEPV